MSYVDDLEALINALVEDKAKELAARKTGKPVPGGVGSSLGGTSLSTDGVIDQGAGGSGGGEDGNEDLKDKLKPGDEPEKLKLYDCETNEEVTLDGIGGGGGAGPAYPTGFENCEKQELPDGEFQEGYYWHAEQMYSSTPTGRIETSGSFQTYSEAAAIIDQNVFVQRIDWWRNAWTEKKASKSQWSDSIGFTEIDGVIYTGTVSIVKNSCAAAYNSVCSLPPPTPKWPAPDKNHLVWNEEKGCMEPLCPELNNQVADKYKACNDELILCDEDGNKVKVTIDGDEMKVTQAKHGQEATIKNGKVQSTKPLTPEQIARAFK